MFADPTQIQRRFQLYRYALPAALIVLLALWILAGGDAGIDPLLRDRPSHLADRLSDWGLWSYYAVLIGLALWGKFWRDPMLAWALRAYLVAQLLGSFAAVKVLKYSCGRPRPDYDNGREAFCPGPSFAAHFDAFPSSHTANAVVGAIFLALLLRRPGWAIPAFLCAIGVALARVISGHHHSSDVLAGAALGTLFALLAVRYVWLPRCAASTPLTRFALSR